MGALTRFLVTTGSMAAVTVALILLLNARVHGQTIEFTASIDGKQANDCVDTESTATGSGFFSLNTATGEVSYEINFDEANLLQPETVAHVHGAAPPCVSTGVVYGVPLGNPKVGTATLTLQEQEDMKNGLHYVNIHSGAFPGGEIRGQILLLVGGSQRPGDITQDGGAMDITDQISLLELTFLGLTSGGQTELSCGNGGFTHPSNLAVFDISGDGLLDLTDAIWGLEFLFIGGPPPVQGLDCITVADCPDVCQ